MLHVGVLSNTRQLALAERERLRRVLAEIGMKHPGILVLHHGCGRPGDQEAHMAVRNSGRWGVHGHPAEDTGTGEVRLLPFVVHGLSKVHESKPSARRDEDIIATSQVLIVMEGAISRPSFDKIRKDARMTGQTVIHIANSAHKPITRSQKAALSGNSPTAASPEQIAWARHKGTEDGRHRQPYTSFRKFRIACKLPDGKAARQMWEVYLDYARPQAPSAPTRQQKRRRRVAGPGTDAMLRKINQLDELSDMWR